MIEEPLTSGELGKRFRKEKFALREEIDGVMVATHVPPENHGRDSTYVSHGCRCDECTEAHREKAREYRDRRKAKKEAEKAAREQTQ